MKAMILERISKLTENPAPLTLAEWPKPVPRSDELLIKVSACGVCHTELDEIEGRTPPPLLPVILGHQVVGRVHELGSSTSGFSVGDRVGVAWIHSACGICPYCRAGNENLCAQFKATGRDVCGGYAEYMAAPAAFVFPIPETFSDVEAAPLLCAGAIGYRSLKLAELKDGENLGLTGFGASAHLVLMMVRHRYPETRVFVFARNPEERVFALELGAAWAGDTDDEPPAKLNAVIDTTPVWKPVVEALKHLAPGGKLVINAIRKEDADKDYLLRLEYPSHLWMEKEIKSVANVARSDVGDFLALAAEIPIRPEVEEYALEDANRALLDLKTHRIRGAKVLRLE
ncbi:zinc-dependent alcohol dehydrogenase family protein [Methylocaldum sp.]|uniref:zinc-dependent alcohol dehydrogenase family protein n=1 Tax=Methylocaldum sp. TaxID=1969727 RepID=UPI002D61F479|nr:zinc-dependent alcohol dehydrogenase family protein [Methylocaldum sp.]HYE33951.1 zinc-dependent alcohol dehydrogenase family protein [Methylocaldum sp.]